jgi:hypothetical protein
MYSKEIGVILDICQVLRAGKWSRVLELLNAELEYNCPLPHVTFLAEQPVFHIAAKIGAPLYFIAALIHVKV